MLQKDFLLLKWGQWGKPREKKLLLTRKIQKLGFEIVLKVKRQKKSNQLSIFRRLTMNELDCGNLAIKFVNKFQLAWWDKGSGGNYDGAYYKPIVPQGFHALGYYGQGNYNSPAGVVVVVKELERGALARPIDYELIWKDKGSGADMDGAFWKPIAPNNYVALGLVVTGNYNKPSVNEVMCVRQDLVQRGKPGDQVWIDKGTGADKDFGSWEIDSPPISGFEEYAYIAAGTFFGVASHKGACWVSLSFYPTYSFRRVGPLQQQRSY